MEKGKELSYSQNPAAEGRIPWETTVAGIKASKTVIRYQSYEDAQ